MKLGLKPILRPRSTQHDVLKSKENLEKHLNLKNEVSKKSEVSESQKAKI